MADTELSNVPHATSKAPTNQADVEQHSQDVYTDHSNHSSHSVAQPKETEPNYPEGIQLFMICFGLWLAILCGGLDRSILSTAIPKITTEFHSLPDIGWYGSAYLLTTCSFQLMFGKLYAELNIKWVYMAVLVIFEVGSVICAAAPNSIAMIIGRAVAGIGCSGLSSGSLIILAHSLPLHKRPKFTGAVASSMGIAQVLAPTLGGVFTDQVSWRWCFWINLPMGGVTLFVLLFLLRLPPRPKSERTFSLTALASKLDFLGTAIVVPAVISLLLAMQWGGTTYSWGNWRIILCLCLFGILTIVWLYHQYRRGEKATVPTRLLRERTMATAIIFTLTGFSNLYLQLYYIPIWFQSVKGDSAQQSGINVLAMTASMTIATVLSGFFTSKIGYYVPSMILSTAMMSAAAGMTYTFSISTSTGFWVGALILLGFGTGAGAQSPLMALQTVFEAKDMAIATSVWMFFQSLGSSIFVSIGANVFQSRLVESLQAIVPEVNPAVIIGNGAFGLSEAMERVYPQFVDGILLAYDKAVQRVFLVGLIMACLSIFGSAAMPWRDVRKGEQKKNANEVEGEQKEEVKKWDENAPEVVE